MVKKRISDFFKYINKKRLTTVAGAWVYYFLISVVPLAFLIVTAFGVFGVNLSTDLVSRLPEEFRATGEAIVSTAERASKSATLLFFITVSISCTTLLNQMSKDGDFLYGVESTTKRGFFRRLWAFGALAVLFTVFLAAAFLFAFGSVVLTPKAVSGKQKILLTVAVFLVVVIISYVIIIVLNKFICPVKVSFKEVGVGGLVSLFIIVLGTIGFTLYLRFFNSYNAFYGSLAAVVVFLLWAYILMLGLISGVIVNTELKKRKVGFLAD